MRCCRGWTLYLVNYGPVVSRLSHRNVACSGGRLSSWHMVWHGNVAVRTLNLGLNPLVTVSKFGNFVYTTLPPFM